MHREERTAQLRRIRACENRTPEDNAYFAILALTPEQVVAVVARYERHHEQREFNRRARLAAEILAGGAEDRQEVA